MTSSTGTGNHLDLHSCLASPRAAIVLLASAASVPVVFNLFPALDIATSGLFFVEAACAPGHGAALACGSFPLRSNAWLTALRHLLQILPFVLAMALGAGVLVRRALGTPFLDRRMLAASVAFWSYVISAGLIVNVILKPHWGRPRPINTTLFGGELPFVPPGGWSGLCPSNCSFASGEAASSFWLLCLVPLLPARWRKVGFAAALSLASVTSFMRVTFGAHFLSDVIFAAILPALVYALLSLLTAWLFGADGSSGAWARFRAAGRPFLASNRFRQN